MATAAQIANLQAQANALQSSLNNAVSSGAIKSGTTTPPASSPSNSSAQLKALSIANSPQSSSQSSSGGGSSLRDLSIALANGSPVTQAQINSGSLPKTGTAAAPINAYQSQISGLPAQTAQTTQAPTTPVSNADTFYKQLVSSLQPSSTENSLTDQQTTLDSTLRNLNQGQGVMNENIKEQPIALPFITGQQAAVERRYALQRGDVQNQQLTVAQRLANAEKQRQASIDVAKAGLDYSQNADQIANTKAQQATTNALNQAQFDAQQTQQQYQNTTQAKQYADTLAQQKLANQIAASKASNTGTKLDTSVVQANGKQLLVNNQTGAVIADLGAVTTANLPEYQQKIADITDANAQFKSVAGNDGYVSPTNYNTARANWVKQGRDVATFDASFSGYINPSHKSDYNQS